MLLSPYKHGLKIPHGLRRVPVGPRPICIKFLKCHVKGCTSDENMVAHVPIHQHTTGLVILPSAMPWQMLYSSVPPIFKTAHIIRITAPYQITQLLYYCHKLQNYVKKIFSQRTDHKWVHSYPFLQRLIYKEILFILYWKYAKGWILKICLPYAYDSYLLMSMNSWNWVHL